LRALQVATLCGMVGIGCTKPDSPAPAAALGPKKPRVDITVFLDPTAEPADAATSLSVATGAPPKERLLLERSGLHFGIVGVPDGLSPEAASDFLAKAVPAAEFAGSNATIIVSRGCLADLQLALQKNIQAFWPVALVVGKSCGGKVKPAIGAAALVEAGKASRVRITFDRHTRAFVKVEPIQ
jgi:hypothetical protein